MEVLDFAAVHASCALDEESRLCKIEKRAATVPIDVVMSAIQELDEGSRFVVETCIRSNKAQCLTAGEECSCECKKLKVHVEMQKFALL